MDNLIWENNDTSIECKHLSINLTQIGFHWQKFTFTSSQLAGPVCVAISVHSPAQARLMGVIYISVVSGAT